MYFLLEAFINDGSATRLGDVHETFFELWNPDAGQNDLDEFLRPPEPLWFGGSYTPPARRTRDQVAKSRIGLGIGLVLLVAVLAFEVHAYYLLAHQLHLYSALFWISALLSVTLLVVVLYFILSS
jgi:hypothetical protein